MNTSLSWIKAYVPDLDVTAQEYTDAMTLSGTKVEGFEEMDADLEKIQEAGLHIITPVLVCNTDEYNKISILKEGEVSPGEDVLQIS